MGRARILAAALAALAVTAAPAPAQEPAPPEERSVLLILDSSKSMNEDAGDGTTRLDAAKAAVRELVATLPADAKVGLRVYGSRVAGASRAEGCRDTRLVRPVGPLDRRTLTEQVDALEGKGRTPIGRSLLAAPGDLPEGPGRRMVILVSDGGDNCAPPDPCAAAEEVARRGLDLSVSVVGLQVAERVRRQLRCIARAGGGTYVDADDPDALREELLAAFSRAFRPYELSGTEVAGTDEPAAAPALGPGAWVDREGIAPGAVRHYAVDLREGQRLFAGVTLLTPPGATSDGTGWQLDVLGPDGERVGTSGSNSVGSTGPVAVESSTEARTLKPAGTSPTAPPGRYLVRVTLGDRTSVPATPVELAIDVLGPGERPQGGRTPGRPTAAPRPSPAPSPSRSGSPRPAAEPADGPGAPLAAGLGIAGLAAGGAGGFAFVRRRRR